MTQTVTRNPDGMNTYKYVMRQNPPAPRSFTATATTQATTIFGLPANHVVMGVNVRLVVAFAAVGMSACAVTLGTTGNTNWYAPTFQCIQTVSPTTFMYWSPFSSFTSVAHDIIATFTSTGAQLTTLTAGEIEFTLIYRSL